MANAKKRGGKMFGQLMAQAAQKSTKAVGALLEAKADPNSQDAVRRE